MNVERCIQTRVRYWPHLFWVVPNLVHEELSTSNSQPPVPSLADASTFTTAGLGNHWYGYLADSSKGLVKGL